MPERPLLVLPEPSVAERERRQGRGGGPNPLTRKRQQDRLGQRLTDIERAFERKRITLQATAEGVVPEEVLILETAGTVEDFYRAVRRIEGLEFLGEFDEDDIPADDDFFAPGSDGTGSYRGRVYLVFANQTAYREILRLWRAWQADRTLGHGLAKWRDVFTLLRAIRPWSVQDRLEETGIIESWQDQLTWNQETVSCEIELWCRQTEAERTRSAHRVRGLVAELTGEVLSEAALPEIGYHALAVSLPRGSVERLLDPTLRESIALIQAEQIQFLRAAGQMCGRLPSPEVETPRDLPAGGEIGMEDQPVVALFDGLPLQNHRSLAGRLQVDDPDGFEQDYEARLRRHGTAMASLIIWGDLHRPGDPIPGPLYVRPVMRPFIQPGWESQADERTPQGVLLVDLIHRAVRRLYEGEGSEQAVAASISVVNLSIGVQNRPYDAILSPLARLLDWLSWKYRVLFLVSAGNHTGSVPLSSRWSDLEAVDADSIRRTVIKSIATDTRNRRLLSPAEAMNVITIGGTHEDSDLTEAPPGWINPVREGFPSPFNAHGPGYRRSVKPELLAPGGRALLRPPVLSSRQTLEFSDAPNLPGHLVAYPGGQSGALDATTKTRGTSNATALMARACAFLVPLLDELGYTDTEGVLRQAPTALWLKVLLAHSARWGEAGDEYRSIFGEGKNAQRTTAELGRLLGFGRVDPVIARECTPTRVTALAGGALHNGEGAEHRFPLPPSLSGKVGYRRLVVTLAWFTPINPLSHRWRRAHLWFTFPESGLSIGAQGDLRRTDADWQSVTRGTLQHEVFEGDRASAFLDGTDLVIKVSCREDAGGLSEIVPYTLAVTLEVAHELGIDIYAEVRERIQARVRVGTHASDAPKERGSRSQAVHASSGERPPGVTGTRLSEGLPTGCGGVAL